MNLNLNNDNMQIPNRSNLDIERENDKIGNEFSRSNNLIVNQGQNLNLNENNDNNYNNNNQVQNKENSKFDNFKLDKSDNSNPNKLSKSDNNPNNINNLSRTNNNVIPSNKISQNPLNKIDDNENKPLNDANEIQEAEKPKVFTNLNFKEEGDAEKNPNQDNNGENNDNMPQNPFLIQKPVVYENKIQKQFKNIFGGNDYFENNYYRKRVMYLTIFCIIVDILHLQVLCLYFNCCFGEYIEMQKWISHTIAPMGLILLMVFVVIYFAADFISKIILQAFNLILIIIMLLYAIFGVFSIVLASQQSPDSLFIRNAWTLLSAYSKIYFYDNDIKVLYNAYFLRMILTGSVYLFIFVCGFFLIIFNYNYTEKIDFIWRPPLRSKLRDERAQRYIDYYGLYNKEYKMLLEQHNQDKKVLNSNNNINSNNNNANNDNQHEANNKNKIGYNNYNSSNENVQLINDNNYYRNKIANNVEIENNSNHNNNFSYQANKAGSQENAAAGSRDLSGNNQILNVLERNNKSNSKKHLLSNEDKNINSNQVSRGSLDKNNRGNSNDNSIANNLINNVDERSNILDNKSENANANTKKNFIPPRKLIKRNKNNK